MFRPAERVSGRPRGKIGPKRTVTHHVEQKHAAREWGGKGKLRERDGSLRIARGSGGGVVGGAQKKKIRNGNPKPFFSHPPKPGGREEERRTLIGGGVRAKSEVGANRRGERGTACTGGSPAREKMPRKDSTRVGDHPSARGGKSSNRKKSLAF